MLLDFSYVLVVTQPFRVHVPWSGQALSMMITFLVVAGMVLPVLLVIIFLVCFGLTLMISKGHMRYVLLVRSSLDLWVDV